MARRIPWLARSADMFLLGESRRDRRRTAVFDGREFSSAPSDQALAVTAADQAGEQPLRF
jgi:hypothetical protein